MVVVVVETRRLLADDTNKGWHGWLLLFSSPAMLKIRFRNQRTLPTLCLSTVLVGNEVSKHFEPPTQRRCQKYIHGIFLGFSRCIQGCVTKNRTFQNVPTVGTNLGGRYVYMIKFCYTKRTYPQIRTYGRYVSKTSYFL